MRDLRLSSIHVPSMDESLKNPLQFLHLIRFSITYRHSKSLCVYRVVLLKKCDRKHKDNYCLILLSAHGLRWDVLISSDAKV